MQMMPEKINAHPETVKNAKPDSSIKFFRFMPYRDATNAPEPIPRVPMENFRSRSIKEFPVTPQHFQGEEVSAGLYGYWGKKV